MTVPRVIIFRDAILDLLEAELGSRMTTAVRNGLSQVLSWVGGRNMLMDKKQYKALSNSLFTDVVYVLRTTVCGFMIRKAGPS